MIKDKFLVNYIYFSFAALSEDYGIPINTIEDIKKLNSIFISDLEEQRKLYNNNNCYTKKLRKEVSRDDVCSID